MAVRRAIRPDRRAILLAGPSLIVESYAGDSFRFVNDFSRIP